MTFRQLSHKRMSSCIYYGNRCINYVCPLMSEIIHWRPFCSFPKYGGSLKIYSILLRMSELHKTRLA